MTHTTIPQTHGALKLARHIVGLAIVLIPVSRVLVGSWDGSSWLFMLIGVVVVAGTVAGLAALFFTASQSSKIVHNFVITAWVAAALILVGALTSDPPRPRAPAVDEKGPWLQYQQGAGPSPADSEPTTTFDPTTAQPDVPQK